MSKVKKSRTWLSFCPPFFLRCPCTQALARSLWPFCQGCILSGRSLSLNFEGFLFCMPFWVIDSGLWRMRFCPACSEFRLWQSWCVICTLRWLAPCLEMRYRCCRRRLIRLMRILFQRLVAFQCTRHRHQFRLIWLEGTWVVFRLWIRQLFRFCLWDGTFNFRVCRHALNWRVDWTWRVWFWRVVIGCQYAWTVGTFWTWMS
jgi:hypothetical protein